MEQILGPDIMGHPVWNIRSKTPQNEATTVPWHQGIVITQKEKYKICFYMFRNTQKLVFRTDMENSVFVHINTHKNIFEQSYNNHIFLV